MIKVNRMNALRTAAIGLIVAGWTATAGLAAPPTSVINAYAQMRAAAQAAAPTPAPAPTSTDSLYLALERLAQALQAVSVPKASGAMPRLRAYIDADKLAAQVLGIASTLRDQNALTAAAQAPLQGPNDGRRDTLADLAGHYNEFNAILDRLDKSHHGNDASGRFNALVDLARLLDVEPKNKPTNKFNPATVKGQLADPKKVRPPKTSGTPTDAIHTAAMAVRAAPAATTAASNAPTSADLGETDEVQLTSNIRSKAAELGNNPVSIRNWVYNNIDYVPSFGSTQNSQKTLLALRGNAFDINSLLIALLRAANIPARYVYGTVDLPADKVRNWLGDLPDANAAVDLLNKSGVPAMGLISGGSIQAIRMEHVWVEAYVNFNPARGARNVAASDTWVPMDASFKGYVATPGLPVVSHVTTDPAAAQAAMLAGSKQGTDWITGIDPNAVQAVNDQITQQVSAYVNTQTITDPAQAFGKRSIVPNTATLLEGTLPYIISSTSTTRYDALPATLQNTLSVDLFDTSFDVNNGSPEFTVSMPLARLGTAALQVNYVGATANDTSLMQQYASANSASLAASSLNVVPQLVLGSTVLKSGAAVGYGTQQYWRVNIADPVGAFSTLPDPNVFPAGTTIAFVADTTGTTPAYASKLTGGYPNTANLPMADALALGGLQYFLLHDLFDDMVAEAHHTAAVRLPSVGAFATAVSVRYFFGVPRTASTQGFFTDVKALRFAVTAPTPQEQVRALSQMGTLGSLSEGLAWSLLTGRNVAGSLSAASLLLRANEAQIPLYLLNANNVSQDLPALALNDDDKTDIQNAIASGLVVLTPSREMSTGAWSGVGYIVLDPTTGAGLWRVSGGLNGAIDVGCIAKALSLNVLCKLMFNKLLQQFIAMLNPGALLAKLAEKALIALVPVVGEIIAVVQLALEIIDITMQVLKWVQGIMNMIDNLTNEDLSELGVAELNDFLCSLGSPCFGNNFFDDIGHNFSWDGFKEGFTGSFAGGILGGMGGGGPGEPAEGNPISVGNGIKWQWERDYDGSGAYPLHFLRTYDSAQTNGSVVGNKWTHTYQSSIHVAPAPLGSDATPQNAVSAILVTHGDGTYSQYTRRGTTYVAESNLPEPVVRLADSTGNTTGWEITRLSDEVEHYDGTGRLQWVRNRAGLKHTLAYNAAGQLTAVSDDFGRSLGFGYDPSGHLSSMTDPDGHITSYGYDANGNATSVTYHDTKSRTYLYEDVQLNSYLTGIIDERGIRYATFAYDYRGRAILSTHTGDAGKISLSYGDNTTTVTDAVGTQRVYTYQLINQRPYLVQVDQPCSAGCSAGGVSKQSFDGNGFVATRTDFNNNTTNLSHNVRGLIENVTEAVGSPQARTTTAQWHTAYHLPVQTNEPLPGSGLRTNIFSYDSSGNLTDVDATAGTDARHWHYTYNAHGQALTAQSPRTDVSSVVKYVYDDTTGNRLSMTDEVGHPTQYTQYDASGRLLQKIDSNGLITKYSYDVRGRLLTIKEQTSATDAGETTTFGYDEAGELTKLTLPDNSYLSYTYDAAQRLTDIADRLGNSVHYTLDGLGNRTQEDTKDPNHVLAQTMSRVMDGLGRLKELHGAQTNEITAYTYDAVGNEKTATDPLSHLTSSNYDALSRLTNTNVLDASDPAHATIGYGYDIRDNLTSVTDPRQLPTNYAYSGFDELLTLTSPDTGATQYQYDPAGNVTLQTDARNQRGAYTYDAGNRLTQIQYGAAGTGNTVSAVEETLSLGYDEVSGGPGAIGRLTHADVSGAFGNNHTAYQYDTHGRVTQQSQQLGSGTALATTTHYNAQGQRDQVILPSGAVIGYAYGVDGRIATITVNGVTIVRDVHYFPFGDVQSWTEGSALGGPQYVRIYDTDGRVTAHTDGAVARGLGYDAASRITTQLDSPAGANWLLGYDGQDRLTSASNAATSGATANASQSFVYDATGNRTSAASNGQIDTYTTDSASNRLSPIGNATRLYDAAGNTTDWNSKTAGSLHASYSARNRLSQIQNGATRYAYNAWGERIAKQGNATTQFVYDDNGHLQGEYDASNNLIEETLWLGDAPVAVLKANSGPTAVTSALGGQSTGSQSVFWIESDQLDTPRAIVNQSHQLVWQWDSDPFGTTLPNENPTSLGSFSYNLRFPGQYFDTETGTHYNYFRDYEPATGRYVESDPTGLFGGINTFGYVNQSPLDSFDPDGLKYKRPPKPAPCKHKNCKDYKGPCYVYAIYKNGSVYKYGESCGPKKERCDVQVRRLNRGLPPGSPNRYSCDVIRNTCGKDESRTIETFLITEHERQCGCKPPGNKNYH